jgi:nucleoside-diphosphate-sugar epimerase
VAGTVVVMGATGPLGRRVTSLLASRGDEVRAAGPDVRDIDAVLDGATAVVHLGRPVRAALSLDGTGVVPTDEASTRRLLEAVEAAGCRVVVWLSSAMVYGAWDDNPIPITEAATRRPNPGLRYAEDQADRDRQVEAWASGHPDTRVAVLRPTITVGADPGGWLGRSPWSPAGVQADDADPPSQFVSVGDLAAAVVLAVTQPLDGAFNVAPDGWIPAERLRALSGPAPRLHLPAPVAERLARARWRFGPSATPPAVLPYTRNPWIIANDRVRAAGWEPEDSNEEAYVIADDGGLFAGIDPRRRQLLSLGAVGLAVAGSVAGVVALVLRRRARRRR